MTKRKRKSGSAATAKPKSVSELETLVNGGPQNANFLSELLEVAEKECASGNSLSSRGWSSIHALRRIFTKQRQTRARLEGSSSTALSAYSEWLEQQSTTYNSILLNLLQSEESPADVQCCALRSLMVIAAADKRKMDRKLVSAVAEAVVCNSGLRAESIAVLLSEYFFKFGDAQYFLLKGIGEALKQKKDVLGVARNSFEILSRLRMPPDEEILQSSLLKEKTVGSWQAEDEQRRVFSRAWVALLRGELSLLALDGLWYLMREFKFDCPDFFDKLYALIVPDLFHAQYRARFFNKLALFLTSSRLAAYVDRHQKMLPMNLNHPWKKFKIKKETKKKKKKKKKTQKMRTQANGWERTHFNRMSQI
eukprot:g2750.t1